MNESKNNWVKIDDCDYSTIKDPAYEFSFELDKFQKDAIYAIENNRNVLVCVGTGSGKTAVAKYAIGLSLKKNKRVIYTSPIKSLSNQKFDEFKQIFPDLGILTGDIRHKPYAQCVIMTTEILRNFLYKKGCANKSEIDLINADELLKDVDCVIFDEVHYINDPNRGKVWEESIIMLDREINLVMLSATIKNPEKFAGWIGNIKQKDINLIIKKERVIPLTHYYYIDNRMLGSLERSIQKNQNEIDKKLLSEFGDDNSKSRLIEILDSDNNFKKGNYDKVRKLYNTMQMDNKYHNYKSIMNPFINFLSINSLVPALFFCFSRKNVENYAKSVTISLVNKEEQGEINKIFNSKMALLNGDYEKINQYHFIKRLLLKGIAAHHSGLIPVLKEIIEILFSKGLIKVLFATETFAVGVNMPTKTVIFTELEKYDGMIEGMRILRTDEYQQMAGRAGRRGLDKVGTVIHIGIRDYQTDIAMRTMMTGGMPEIKSKFSLSYQFIMKVINFKSENQNIMDFIKYSLMEKENSSSIVYFENDLNEVKKELEKYTNNDLSKTDLLNIEEYNKITDIMNAGYTIKGKQLKKYKSRMKELDQDTNFINLLTTFNKKRDLEKKIKNIEYDIDQCLSGSKQTVLLIIDYLDKYGYLKLDVGMTEEEILTINKDRITVKGLIGMEINECNELIFTEMIYEEMINHMTPEEIVATIAVFIEERSKEEINNIKSLNIPYLIKDVLFEVNRIVQDMSQVEYDNWININTDWNLYFTFISPAYKWACGKSIQEICETSEIYEGNFVKHIIKINKICQDILKICEITKNDVLKKKVEQIEPLIIRDIVTVESLYIN